MKKLAIAASSVALAAMPVVGVFAAEGTVVTDTVEVTIDPSCLITSTSAANTYSAKMTNSQLKSDFGSTTMSISCNDAGGWHVTAVGDGADSTDKTVMNAAANGTDIATGTATSGAASNWAMKVTGGTATGFTTFAAVPGSATDVAKSTVSTSQSEIVTTYQVWISATQQADTYTGVVKYTLAHPAA